MTILHSGLLFSNRVTVAFAVHVGLCSRKDCSSEVTPRSRHATWRKSRNVFVRQVRSVDYGRLSHC